MWCLDAGSGDGRARERCGVAPRGWGAAVDGGDCPFWIAVELGVLRRGGCGGAVSRGRA